MKKRLITLIKILFIGFLAYFIIANCFYLFYFSPMNGKHTMDITIEASEQEFYETIKKDDHIKIVSFNRYIYKTSDNWRNIFDLTYYVKCDTQFIYDTINKKHFDKIVTKTAQYIRDDKNLKKYKFKNIRVIFYCKGSDGALRYNFGETDERLKKTN